MNYEIFAKLYTEALDYPDIEYFIADRGWEEWMSEEAIENDIESMNLIFKISKMDFRELRELSGYSRPDMSRKYKIPLRTLQDWETKKREPPLYVTILIAYAIFINITGRQNG